MRTNQRFRQPRRLLLLHFIRYPDRIILDGSICALDGLTPIVVGAFGDVPGPPNPSSESDSEVTGCTDGGDALTMICVPGEAPCANWYDSDLRGATGIVIGVDIEDWVDVFFIFSHASFTLAIQSFISSSDEACK